MTDSTKTPVPPSEIEDSNAAPSFMRYIYIGVGVLVGLFALTFILAILASVFLAGGTFGEIIAIIRDVMFIFLALEGILIILALTILIAQVARLVNLVQSEIKPILRNTQETVQYAKGTVEFVGKNLTQPVMTANTFMAAGVTFAKTLFRLGGNINSPKQETPVTPPTEEKTDANK